MINDAPGNMGVQVSLWHADISLGTYIPRGRLLCHMNSDSIRNFLLCVYYTVYQFTLQPTVCKGSMSTHLHEHSRFGTLHSSWRSGTGLICVSPVTDGAEPVSMYVLAHICSCYSHVILAGVQVYCPFSVRLFLQLSFWSSLHILCFSLSLDVWFTDAFLLASRGSLHCFLYHVEAYPFAVTLLVCLASFLVLWVMSHSLSTILMSWNIPLLVTADVTVKNLIHSELFLTSEAGVYGIQCVQPRL